MMNRSLSAIGFVGGRHRLRADLIQLLAGSPTEIMTCEAGEYRVWRSGEGAEVWMHVCGGPALNGQPYSICGVTPFHASDSAVDVSVTGILPLDKSDPLAGGFVCYLPTFGRGDRELQIILEMVSFAMTRSTDPPFRASVEILGLISEATVYPSLAEYFVRVATARLVAPSAVVPLLTSAGSEQATAMADDLRCVAIVTGRIVDSRRLVNSITGLPYWHLLVATERGMFALVAAEADVHGVPAIGTLIQAKARLVGRLRDAAPARPAQEDQCGVDASARAAGDASAVAEEGTDALPLRRVARGR